MAIYRISGIWENKGKVITHYAFHEVNKESISKAKKVTKSEAIKILETRGNSAKTWTWNYKAAKWSVGEVVEVVNGANGKYLRSDPDNKLSNNLGHLIDFDWIAP